MSDTIDNTHPIQLEALGTFFNLVEPSIYDPEGVLFGFDDTKRPVILDRYALSGHSAISGRAVGEELLPEAGDLLAQTRTSSASCLTRRVTTTRSSCSPSAAK
ncbi:hypothetical protein [Haloplanus litoreus]|uniref:Uncharacterized protein n=1 Tax=Haloplanus litoreus TaxID=767515 RepID=A0ABD6A3K8_9EURY